MIVDQLALLIAAACAMRFADEWAASLTMIASLLIVTSYELMTGGYAVNGVYILADLVCAVSLTGLLILTGRTRTGVLIGLGFWLCCMIHGVRLMGLWPDILSYWWALRIVNACQIIILGASCVGGGKRYRRAGTDLPGWSRRPDHVVAARTGNPG